MRLRVLILLAAGAVALCGTAPGASSGGVPDRAQAMAAFEAITPALRHPRCLVCHSSGDYRRQGKDLHPHIMDVCRGPHGDGAPQHLPSGSQPYRPAHASRRPGLAPAAAGQSDDLGRTDGQPVVPASHRSEAQWGRIQKPSRRTCIHRWCCGGGIRAKDVRQKRCRKAPS